MEEHKYDPFDGGLEVFAYLGGTNPRSPRGTVVVYRDWDDVCEEFLTPAQARALATHILKLADEAENEGNV